MAAQRQIKGILFDNDGTLVDTESLILSSFRHTLQTAFGKVPPDEELLKKVGQPLSVQMEDFATDEVSADELCKIYREHNHRIHDGMIRLFPGIREMLEELRSRGYKMGVVTSKTRELASHGLNVLGVLPFFECVVGGYDLPKHKPDPEPVIYGAELLGLAPEECAYVGDSPFDMQAGNGAGCLTIAALWGMFSASALRAEHPDFECSAPEDLLALFPSDGSTH